MPIAELFLGAFLRVLFQRLTSRKLLDFARREGIDKLLKKWEKRLKRIDRVLDDAEDKQLNGNPEVKLWLEDLRNLAYDIDDLLDEFATKSAENKSNAEPGCSKVRSLLPSCCFRLSPCEFFDCKMRSKIVDMDKKLQEISKTLKDDLSLVENNGQRSAYNRLDRRPPTTNLPEPYFVSREDEKRKILELLTTEEDDVTSAYPKVIPIVGMGGVGKTALAQEVYNDARVTEYFDVKAWTCVSVNFDVLAITKSILGTIDSHLSCEGKDLNWLQDKLKENLSGKKFLVVLDDVWNENYGNWTTLLKPFQSGAKGSKIIITTRNLEVASTALASPITLNMLPLDACMTLFAFHALGVQNFDHHPDLEVLGQKIVEKCKGLPLAVKALAGSLRTKVNPYEWEAILNSKLWDLPEERIEIIPALKLSYLHLTPNLRRCFAYCAIIPKDYEIERDELIRWWSAEGLLEGKEGMSHWNAGLNYFNELVSRSLFQKSSSDGSRFVMHDLVNDLAKLVAGATCFDSGEFEGDHNNASFTRHASVILSDQVVPKRLEIYYRMQGLRSFILLEKKIGNYDRSYLSEIVLSDLLSGLKYLRVLSLSGYCISKVPDCIGRLRHLRYLNLSYSDIETLPKSIVALYNLEALMLKGCYKLIELPEGMEKLINLRFLDITDTRKLIAMPLNIGNLVGLEMLSKFVVGTENGSRLKELKNLNIREELYISNLHMVQEAGDAKDANLCMKEGLRQLTMQWGEDFENFRDEELEQKVLNILCPHRNLGKLGISYYGGLKFPLWLGSPAHVNIVHLRLHGCRRAKTLPSLGQLSLLKELYIEGLNAICIVGSEFYGTKNPFLSLITLEFKDMPSWKDWSHCVVTEEVGVLFPRLENLVIQNCPMLIGTLPSQLSSLKNLEINSCPHMDAVSSIISLPSLNELNFGDCNEGVLKSLVNLTSLTALKSIEIKECRGVESLVEINVDHFQSLQVIEIRHCENLKSLPQDLHTLSHLTSLRLVNCPAQELECFPPLPPGISRFELWRCPKIRSLPNQLYRLTCLRHLTIRGCESITRFPNGGLPRQLQRLWVTGCGNMKQPVSEWLTPLTSLQFLKIDGSSIGGGMGEEEELVLPLPSSLLYLYIYDMGNVERLSSTLPPSLRSLEIYNCPKLRELPQDEDGHGLPPSLEYLEIEGCPILEERCRKGTGCYWPLIRHIPRVMIDKFGPLGSTLEKGVSVLDPNVS